ncbi:MAG: hypothetical protein KC423_28825, partial [Anaerolineales bacterium]|nr:hypothetical protein [Anaerolineales bacterium]
CANLACANLERALVTSQQLDLAWCLTGAVMPDGTKLRDSGEEITGVDWDREINLTGPTFEEWAALQEIVTSDGEEE